MYDKVFLDLEETVIVSWHDRYFTNVQKVRDWLKEHQITEVGIFSFAIYNDADKEIFEKEIKVGLADAFGISITTWPSVLEMMKIDTKFTGDRWFDPRSVGQGVTDYINTRGKQQGFINFANAMYPDARNIALLDDVVQDVTLTYRDTGRQIHLVNVDKLDGIPSYRSPKLAY
jgi:hypothetical protein